MRPGCFGSLSCWLGRRRQVDSLETSKASNRGSKKLQPCGEAAGVQLESQTLPLPAPPLFEHPVCKDTIQEETSEQGSEAFQRDVLDDEDPETGGGSPKEEIQVSLALQSGEDVHLGTKSAGIWGMLMWKIRLGVQRMSMMTMNSLVESQGVRRLGLFVLCWMPAC